jgi:hypothetical protein
MHESTRRVHLLRPPSHLSPLTLGGILLLMHSYGPRKTSLDRSSIHLSFIYLLSLRVTDGENVNVL